MVASFISLEHVGLLSFLGAFCCGGIVGQSAAAWSRDWRCLHQALLGSFGMLVKHCVYIPSWIDALEIPPCVFVKYCLKLLS